jgi:hypothetical protein
MTQFRELLDQVATLRSHGVGGDQLQEALDDAFDCAPEDALDATDALRTIYTESEDHRSLARWALIELDSEVSEFEDLGLGL